MIISSLSQHLEKLRYFAAVAVEGSFASAAHKFHLAQPTLSHSVQVLEDVLKTKLFHRSSTGVKLTSAGESLLSFAQKLLAESEQLEHSLRLSEEKETTLLTVGTKEPYAVSQWPTYMKLIDSEFPKIDLILKISRSNEELLNLLTAEKIDLALMPDPPESQKWTSYELFEDSLDFYAPPSLLKRLEPDQLQRLPLYVFQNALCGNKGTIHNVLKNNPLVSNLARDVDSFNVARSLVLEGLGVALLPESFVREDLAKKRLVRFEYPGFSSEAFGTTKACFVLLEKNKRNITLKAVRHALRDFHLHSN